MKTLLALVLLTLACGCHHGAVSPRAPGQAEAFHSDPANGPAIDRYRSNTNSLGR